MKQLTFLSAILLTANMVLGQIIHVPADYATIQEGIHAASDGDTVLVAENTYYENINFDGRAIVLASEFIIDGDHSHIANTIIDGSQPGNPDKGSVVTFDSGEDTTSVLCGFTVTGGTGTLVAPANARSGGGIFITGSGCKLLNNYIEYNEITDYRYAYGGGINAGGPASPLPWVVLQDNRINHNKAISTSKEGVGGGIENAYNLKMINNTLSNNEANGALRGDGGGGHISGWFGHIEVEIRNNLIAHNKAISNSQTTDIVIGGGLDIFGNITGIVSDNSISFNEIEVANEKWGYGAGIMIEEINADNFVFENNFVSDNIFTGGYGTGGGLCIWDSKGNFLNNIIQNNSATSGGGVRIGLNSDKLAILINNTITGNEASNGGGLYFYDANAVIINSIIWDNIADLGASIYNDLSVLEVRYSDVEGEETWPGQGNMNVEPEFRTDGYHLDYNSTLLNKGQSTVIINGEYYDCPLFDIDGDERPFSNTHPDIGADEAQWLYVSVDASVPVYMNLTPNPADHFVTINCIEAISIEEVTIYKQTGQKVYRGIPENNSLDISRLQPGMYVVEVVSRQGIIREKLLVK